MIWVVTFLATVFLDVATGLGTALVFSILTIIARSQKPKCCMLGRIGDTDLYVDTDKYPQVIIVL